MKSYKYVIENERVPFTISGQIEAKTLSDAEHIVKAKLETYKYDFAIINGLKIKSVSEVQRI